MRLGKWNIETLTSRSKEFEDILRRRNVNMYFVLKTKWKGEKAEEIYEGYKIIYSGKTSTKSSVGVMVYEEIKGRVVEVIKKINRVNIMKVI